MRRIVYLALGFAAACGLNLYADGWFPKLLGFGAILCLSILAEKKPGALTRCLSAALGIAVGLGWFSMYTARHLNPITPLDGEVVDCVVEAMDYSRATEYGSAVDGTVKLADRSYRVTAYLKQTERITPGDLIAGSFRLRITTEAGEDPSSYYQGKGIFLLAYQKGEIQLSEGEPSVRHLPAILRYHIQNILEK